MDFEWNHDDPLKRCTRETKAASAALHDYYDLGVGRSLRVLHERYMALPANGLQTPEPPTRNKSTINGWSLRYSWVARVERAEEIQRERDEIARLELEQAERQIWVQRQAETREDMYQAAVDLKETTMNLLALLKKWKVRETEEEGPDGERIITRTIAPNVRLSELARALDISEGILAEVLQMPQRAQPLELAGKGGAPLTNVIEVIVHK